MKNTTSICLVALAALVTSATLPASADMAAFDLPVYQIASDDDLATVVGGISEGECVTAVAVASTTMKVGGGWLATINPVVGLGIVGLGLLASAATVLCTL